MNLAPVSLTAILGEDVDFKPNLTYFLQVTLHLKDGQLIAYPVKGNGSGDLASLTAADGFIELPKQKELSYKKGHVFPIHRYRNFEF